MGETAGRMLEHLSANHVDFGQTPLKFGYNLAVDPATQSFIGNADANALVTRDYRAPYVVPAIA